MTNSKQHSIAASDSNRLTQPVKDSRNVYAIEVNGDGTTHIELPPADLLAFLFASAQRCPPFRIKGRYTKFLRGQALLYRGVLKPYSRKDFERAYQLFTEVVGEHREMGLQASFQSARALCNIAKLFEDEEMEKKGKAILDAIPEIAKRIRMRIPQHLKNQILSERETCSTTFLKRRKRPVAPPKKDPPKDTSKKDLPKEGSEEPKKDGGGK